MNPSHRARLEAAGLRFTGFDATGEIRACELPSHPFFIGTLFQPERSALRGEDHPLVPGLCPRRGIGMEYLTLPRARAIARASRLPPAYPLSDLSTCAVCGCGLHGRPTP